MVITGSNAAMFCLWFIKLFRILLLSCLGHVFSNTFFSIACGSKDLDCIPESVRCIHDPPPPPPCNVVNLQQGHQAIDSPYIVVLILIDVKRNPPYICSGLS